jgi:RimJ/RimL family protein N-acetyltransferase
MNTKLNVRQLEEYDLPQAADLRNEYIQFLRQSKFLNLNDQVEWFRNENNFYFVLENDCNGRVIEENVIYGIAGLTLIDMVSKKAEISLITNQYIAKKYADPLIKHILQYGFDILGLNKIYSTVYEYDKLKQKLWKSLKWNFDGEIRDEIYYKNQYHSLLHYSILKSEYYGG